MWRIINNVSDYAPPYEVILLLLPISSLVLYLHVSCKSVLKICLFIFHLV